MNAFRKINCGYYNPQKDTFEIQIIDLPLICAFKPDGKSVKSKYGYVGIKKDVKILDAWHNWKDGEPMPKILKERVSK